MLYALVLLGAWLLCLLLLRLLAFLLHWCWCYWFYVPVILLSCFTDCTDSCFGNREWAKPLQCSACSLLWRNNLALTSEFGVQREKCIKLVQNAVTVDSTAVLVNLDERSPASRVHYCSCVSGVLDMCLRMKCMLWGDFHPHNIKKALPSMNNKMEMSCTSKICMPGHILNSQIVLGVLLESLKLRCWDLFIFRS